MGGRERGREVPGYEHARNETKGGTKETKYIQAHEERLGNIFREHKHVHLI